MGEIAEMMLDGTMDPETGEFNFDGEDGPGWPMTAAEARAYKRGTRGHNRARHHREPYAARPAYDGATACSVTKAVRKKIEAFGNLRANDFYHWQVRKGGRLVADWWPHRSKYRIADKTMRGNAGDFVRALAKAAGVPG